MLGHALIDLNGHFLSVDARFAEIMNSDELELHGQNLLDVTFVEDRPRNQALLQQLLDGGAPFTITKRYVRPDGSIVWTKDHVSVFREGDSPSRLVVASQLLQSPPHSQPHRQMTHANEVRRHVEQWGVLGRDEMQAILAMIPTARRFERGDELVKADGQMRHSCIVLDGFLGQAKTSPQAQRQITSLHIPGDLLGFNTMRGVAIDHSIVALSDGHAAFLPHEQLLRAVSIYPSLSQLFLTTAEAEVLRSRAWIFQLGRRSAAERLAHLICETFYRLKAVGAASPDSFMFPINQTTLSDLLGVSAVHTNRSLRYLRKQELISWDDGRMTLRDPARLMVFAQFEPSYLSYWNR